jgi:methyltransferase
METLAEWHPLSVAILLFVTLQRGAELVLAQRNTRRLLAKGAFEVAPGHYPAIVALHLAWLAGLWALAPSRAADPVLLGVYALLQAARLWVLATLGERWTTRIIVLRDSPLVRSGPYRYISHPNYAVVVSEIFILPCVFGLWTFAVLFSVLNAAVLAVRIRAENRALSR